MHRCSPGEDFDEYYRANLRRVGGRAVLLTGNRADAEDITQEAFAALYRHWPAAQTWDEGRRSGYLSQTLLHLAANLVREQVRQRGAADRLSRGPRQVIQFEDDVINRLIALGGDVAAILGRLSSMERLALVLLEVEDLAAQQTATMLGISGSTLRTYHQRAREKLREYRSAERVSRAGARTES